MEGYHEQHLSDTPSLLHFEKKPPGKKGQVKA
jgi:hypothetical protein